MEPSVAERLAERIETLSAGERKAAHALVANYPLLGLKTVAEFAGQAGVSSPTILRFVARLGFQNYPEFQSALQDEVAARLQSPAARPLGTGLAAPGQSGAPPLVEAMLENVHLTVRSIGSRHITEVAAMLAAPRAGIHLLGGRFTDALARYMASHLALVRPGIVHLAGQESVLRDRLVDLGKRDVLVVFDIRRYQESLLRVAEKAHGRGVQIVLMSDQWLSPIARFARHVLAARTGVPSPWDSSVALMVLCELLIAEVTRLLKAESARRLAALEALR